jgi:hypothetical protein
MLVFYMGEVGGTVIPDGLLAMLLHPWHIVHALAYCHPAKKKENQIDVNHTRGGIEGSL